jgi:hypothetical protein
MIDNRFGVQVLYYVHSCGAGGYVYLLSGFFPKLSYSVMHTNIWPPPSLFVCVHTNGGGWRWPPPGENGYLGDDSPPLG